MRTKRHLLFPAPIEIGLVLYFDGAKKILEMRFQSPIQQKVTAANFLCLSQQTSLPERKLFLNK